MSEAIRAQFGIRIDFTMLPENQQNRNGVLDLLLEKTKIGYKEKIQEVPGEILHTLKKPSCCWRWTISGRTTY